MTRRFLLGYSVAFLAFVTLPLVLWVFGYRTEPDPLVGATDVPDLSFENLANGDYTSAAGAWLTEQSPLRQLGAQVEAWVDVGVFGDSASPKVAIGRDDWLFYKDSLDLQTGCAGDSKNFEPEDIVGTVSLLADVVRASGREFWFTEIPGKSQAYPDKLTNVLLELGECSKARRTAVRELFGGYDWYVDTWLGVEDYVATSPAQPLYFPQDTHWTTRGGALLTEHLVEAIQPGLWAADELTTEGEDQIIANLAFLLERRTIINSADHWAIDRPGVSIQREDTMSRVAESTELVDEDEPGALVVNPDTGRLDRKGEWVMIDNRPVRSFQTASTDATLIADQTFMIHDSFSWFAMAQLPLFFEDLTMANLYNTADTPWLETGIQQADRVIIEMGEEYVWDYVHAGTPFVSKVIDGVSDTLPSRPIPADDLIEDGSIEAVGAAGDAWTIADKSGALEFSAPAGNADRRLLIFDVTTPEATVTQIFDGEGEGAFPAESVQQQAVPAGTHPVVFDMTSRGPRLRLEPGKASGVEVSNVRIVDIIVPDTADSGPDAP